MAFEISGNSINIRLDEIHAVGVKGVTRTSAFIGFSFNSLNSAPLPSFHADGCHVRLTPEELSAEQLHDYKTAYQKWVSGNSIRELVESFGRFLNGIYFAAGIIAYLRLRPFEEIRTRSMKFEQCGELKRLNKLSSEFSIKASVNEHLESLIATRNAVTHRSGMVLLQPHRVLWRKMEAFVTDDEGVQTVIALPVIEPVKIEKGGRVGFRFVDAHKEFAVGEQIYFDATDVHDMCLMVQSALDEIVAQVRELAARNGVEPKL